MSLDAARHGPWALIAGASEGIGAAFARRIAAAGINVALVARREERLQAVADELATGHGVDTRVIALDLSVPGAEDRLFARTADLEVGLLVYNAGADDHAAFFLDVPVEEWVKLVQRNCVVPLRAAHHYGAAMVARGRGGVILVTSGAAWAGGARLATYGATKAFDLVLGEGLWAEWRDRGVDVLALVVGATATPAFLRLLERVGSKMEGLADPDDVAAEGLAHLADGPTWSCGMPDGGAGSPFGALARRDAVLLMTGATESLFGSGR
jgi:short-subunit dehydrogenase